MRPARRIERRTPVRRLADLGITVCMSRHLLAEISASAAGCAQVRS
jgi:hypothetical protein